MPLTPVTNGETSDASQLNQAITLLTGGTAGQPLVAAGGGTDPAFGSTLAGLTLTGNLTVQNASTLEGTVTLYTTLVLGGETVTYASSITVPTGIDTAVEMTTTSAVGDATLNAAGAGTAYQPLHIIVHNDATAARTITFGTHFVSVGPLIGTPGETAIVSFLSNGSAFYEVARSVQSGGGGGTVTSVGLSTPGVLYSVSGSPITGSGTLALALINQSANQVLAGPTTGADAAPAFRALVDADVPNVMTSAGDLIVGGASGARTRLAKGTDGQVLTVDPTTHLLVWATPASPGTGTVTSVALTVPGDLSVSGSPVTGAGTLAVTRSNQSANQVLAGPTTGAAATPAYRALVAADIPNLAASKITSSQLAQAQGGTGKDTSAATNGQLLIGKTSDNSLNLATLTAGTGIAVTNGAGAVTVAGAAFVASGGSHAAGDVPDPGSTAGTTKFLREDATWQVPAGGGSGAVTQIAQTVLGSAAASIIFSSIPGTYTDLLLTGTVRGDSATRFPFVYIQINGDTASTSYWWRKQENASGSQGIPAAQINLGNCASSGFTTGAATQFNADFKDYASTTWMKGGSARLAMTEPNNSNIYDTSISYLWQSISAITSIKVFPSAGNFITGSVLTLWGIS